MNKPTAIFDASQSENATGADIHLDLKAHCQNGPSNIQQLVNCPRQEKKRWQKKINKLCLKGSVPVDNIQPDPLRRLLRFFPILIFY